ncbi:MAG: CcoQ/FixQ family Cbb3-type cytochrome c oxidase assembly chaperone [Gammaproteobacteria bacterium]
MSTLLSIWTVVVFVFFIAVVIWAWSGKRKQAFDAASRIPLDDDTPTSETIEETDHG